MSYLKRNRTVLATVATSCVSQAVLVFSGIGATRILGAEDRGRLALFNLLPTLLVLLGTFGLPIATTYFIARNPRGARGTARMVLGAALPLTAVLTALDTALLALLEHAQSRAVLVAAAISLPLVASNVAQLMGQAVLQGLQRYRAFNLWRTLPSLTYACAVAALYFSPVGDLFSLTLAFVVTSVVVAALTLYAAIRALPPKTAIPESTVELRDVFRFGLTGVLGAVYPTETFQLDQAAVGLFLPARSLGLYVVAISFTNLPRFIAQSFGLIAYPRAAAAKTPRGARRIVLRFAISGGLTAVGVCGALELTVHFLAPLLYGKAFSAAVSTTRILLISSCVISARRVLADGLRGAGYPGIGSLGETVAMALLLPLLIVLVSAGGLHGAAIAVTASSLVGFLVILSRAVPALQRMKRLGARVPAPELVLSIDLPPAPGAE